MIHIGHDHMNLPPWISCASVQRVGNGGKWQVRLYYTLTGYRSTVSVRTGNISPEEAVRRAVEAHREYDELAYNHEKLCQECEGLPELIVEMLSNTYDHDLSVNPETQAKLRRFLDLYYEVAREEEGHAGTVDRQGDRENSQPQE